VDKAGAKLKISENQVMPFDVPIKPTGSGRFVGTSVSMSYLCFFLSQQLNFPVLDQTGLGGYYDFTLEWMPMGLLKHETPFTPEGPGLGERLRNELGLKLESRKASVEAFVIDHVEKPSEN
jgi:uncharacterized protein (TIGR03435 family)